MSDLYQSITDWIVAQIEQGAADWRMPWHSRKHGASELTLPRNVTGRAYRGVNVPVLWATAAALGYESPVWATYKQWQERGAQVRKGEKAAMVVFWKAYKVDRDGTGDDEGDDTRLVARAYFVFNAAQVDGFDAEKIGKPEASPEDLSEGERIATADRFFAATGSIVRHGGNKAFYTPSGDFIQMPDFPQFVDAESYYSVLAHEHTHWTGSKARLDRDFSGRFGSEAYAFEELVAELGAAYLCASLGLSNEPRLDHAAYIAGWLKVLKGEEKGDFHGRQQGASRSRLYAFAPSFRDSAGRVGQPQRRDSSMSYRRFHWQARPTPRVITVKYPGKCACCGAEIKAGETATYYPAGTIASVAEGRIAHVGGLEGNSPRCTVEIRNREFPEYHAEVLRHEAEQRALNDYAGDGLDARWEDQGRDICGR